MNDFNTWWSANETVEVDDPKLGKLRISQWKDLHFRTSASHDALYFHATENDTQSSGNRMLKNT